ncbi:hypothetical protein H4R19_006637, partial [Coemansia spiralis]
LSTNCQTQALSRPEQDFKTHIITEKLIQVQEDAAQLSQELSTLREDGADKETVDRRSLSLINMLMPEKVPDAHNMIGSEVVRVMTFYLDVLRGPVTSLMLNALLAALIKNGRFDSAWRVVLGDFEKFDLAKDGWTFLRMIELCARTRDVPSAWRVWDEFKAWRASVERALKTPGHESLRPARTRVFASDPAAAGARATDELHGDAAALERSAQDTLALAEALTFPGENALPACVAGGALAVTPADREVARRKLGCDMKTEHATYIEMVTLLGSAGDFRSAIQLLREEEGILEHKHNPTMQDVGSLYQIAVVAGNQHAALDIRGLCMQKPLHSGRRALHRKWGTSFSWDLTEPQHRSLSRRFPEEYRRHRPPFRDGEHVYSRSRDGKPSANSASA